MVMSTLYVLHLLAKIRILTSVGVLRRNTALTPSPTAPSASVSQVQSVEFGGSLIRNLYTIILETRGPDSRGSPEPPTAAGHNPPRGCPGPLGGPESDGSQLQCVAGARTGAAPCVVAF